MKTILSASKRPSQKAFFEFTDYKEGETVQISIYDVSGRLMQDQATIIDEVIELDISQWKSGMYFFTAENKTTKSAYSGKLVIGH